MQRPDAAPTADTPADALADVYSYFLRKRAARLARQNEHPVTGTFGGETVTGLQQADRESRPTYAKG